MNKLATSILLAHYAYAQTAPCTDSERAATVPACAYTNVCTTTNSVPDCGAVQACTANTDCVGYTGYCNATDGVCANCPDEASCNPSGGTSQCPTSGTKSGVCTTDSTCTTAYATTDECSVGAYCSTALACTANCAATSDCSIQDQVCQDLTSMCTPICATAADCTGTYDTGAGSLCGTTDTAAAPYNKPAGVCYAPVCTTATLAAVCDARIQDCPAATGLCTAQACTTGGDCDTGFCSNSECAVCVSGGNLALECAINQTCDEAQDGTGACQDITCTTTDAYADSACFEQKTICVEDTAGPPAGTCAVCDPALQTNQCATGYTCNTTTTNNITLNQCLADQCGDNAAAAECALDYQTCSDGNQCVNIACDSSVGGDPSACDASTRQCVDSQCVPCVNSGPDCPTTYYCNLTAQDYGVCTQDCTTDDNCSTWQTCDAQLGECQGANCTDTTNCAGASGTNFATCVNSKCSACSATAGDATACPTGQFCSTGSTDPSQAAYESGVCYASECNTAGDDCDAVTKTCDANTGLCVDIPCTADSVATDCPKTMVCDTSLICGSCTVTAGSVPTTNCPADYWCTETTGACYAGECTVATQETTCQATDPTTACNGTTLLCEQQTCATNSDCYSNLCAAATAGSNCVTCTDTAACQVATTGGDATYYCNATTSVCFAETCTGASSVPVADVDSCVNVSTSCTDGLCAATTGCTAEANTCRSNADGLGLEGVCDVATSTCAECTITTDSETNVTTSDCPGASAYCNTSTASTTGNYCTMSLCNATGTVAMEGQTACDAWQTCDVANTGVCVDQACTAATDCTTTLVCTDAVCAGCDEVAGSGNECPTTTDEDTYYTCEVATGVCLLGEETGISGGGIAGIIIGSVVFLGAVVGLTLYCCKKDSKSHDAMQEALK